MVGPLNVHGLGEAAFEFGEMISDVGHKVGERAVRLAHHAILVVVNAEILTGGRAKPKRLVLFISAAGIDHRLDGSLNAS